MKRVFLLVACCLLTTSLAFSQMQPGQTQPIRPKARLIHAPTTCPNDPVLMSDGTINGDDLSFANTTNYYQFNAKNGHSYSIEVWDVFDPYLGVQPNLKVTTNCTDSVAGLADVTGVDPDLSNGFSRRVSWIQTTDQTLYIGVVNPDQNQNDSFDYYIRVTDTSLHATLWSTYNPFDSYWSFANLTSSDITGNLTVVNDQGVTVLTKAVTVPAEGFVQVKAKQNGVPVNEQGAATFVYVGPPGAVKGDTTIIKADSSVIVLPSFVPQHSSY